MEDLRTKARFLLAVRSKDMFAEAVKCCELLVRLPYATANDRFALAQLYLRTGNKAAYEEQMHAIIDPQHPQPVFLMSYINTLLDRREFEDADGKLQILEKAAPGSFEAMQFRAEYFFRRGQYQQAADKIEAYISGLDPQSPDRGRQIHRAARLMEDYAARLTAEHKPDTAGFLAKASDRFLMLRNLALDGNMAYAAFSARQGRIGEALSLLENTWDQSKPDLVQQPAVCIIVSPATTAEQLARLEKLLVGAQKANYSAVLLTTLSSLYEHRRQYDKAIESYRQILAKEPRNYFAMNNLAVDLVRSGGDLNEALDLVNRALGICGPQAAVLDSRAMVLIARQECDKALVDLNTAVSNEGTADQYFHLAWALSLVDRKSEAADALKTAEAKGLDPKSLSSYEKPVYDRLKESL
jgi:tetratricopeptide (TPR) repeat protein